MHGTKQGPAHNFSFRSPEERGSWSHHHKKSHSAAGRTDKTTGFRALNQMGKFKKMILPMDQGSVQEEFHFNILYMQRCTQVASWEGTYFLILSH